MSPLPGVYGAEIDILSTGNWFVVARIDEGTIAVVGVGALPVVAGEFRSSLERRRSRWIRPWEQPRGAQANLYEDSAV